MRPPPRFVSTLALALVATALVSAQTAPPKKAIDVYREYQAAVKTATTIAPILPFLTKEYADNLKAAPKDQQERMLKRLTEHAAWTNIVVTAETTKAGGILELKTTAMGPEGAMLGTIAFKNEGNAWKIEGQGWVADFANRK